MASRLAGQSGPPPEEARSRLIRTDGPWRGYRPSLSHAFGGLDTAQSMANLIIRNGALTWDYGWSRYEDTAPVAVPLPLGGNATPFPGGALGNPIALLDYYQDNMGSGNEATIAVTADAAAGGNGEVFYFPHSGAATWLQAADISATGFNTDTTNVFDSCLYPYSYLTGAGALPRGTMLITNGVRDPANARVIIYPGTAANNYATAATPTATPDMSNSGPFGCRSLASYAERVYALNTLEGANPTNRRQPSRLRWTRPGWTSYAATIWQSSTGLGAGYQDLLFCPGEGVAVRQLGRSLACYFSEGTVILKTTGQLRPAHSLVYSNTSRGLLGTRAVADLGGGIHFGAFTDGFWFLTEGGEWKEAGIANEGGLRYRKFTDQFFALLHRETAYRINVGFDQDRRLVYVSFPTSSTAFATWVYDIDLDEMYPQTWGALTGISTAQTARAFAFVDKSAALPIGRCLIHGSASGHVWEHTASTSQRNANAVTWAMNTHAIDHGLTFSYQTVTEGWADLYAHGAATSVTHAVIDPAVAVADSNSKTTDINLARQSLRFPHNHAATSLYHQLSGTHPISLFGIGARVERTGEPGS